MTPFEKVFSAVVFVLLATGSWTENASVMTGEMMLWIPFLCVGGVLMNADETSRTRRLASLLVLLIPFALAPSVMPFFWGRSLRLVANGMFGWGFATLFAATFFMAMAQGAVALRVRGR